MGGLRRWMGLLRLGTDPASPPPPPDIDWLYPWVPLDDPQHRAVFNAQLRAEIGPEHVLRRRRTAAIARVDGLDDMLFLLDGGEVAQVHLTFAKQMERDPRWPRTAIFPSLEAWSEAVMRPDHHDWTIDGANIPV